MTQFTPSPEQQAIFDAVLNTRANIAISALAGTGKTTSLVELSKRLHATTGSKIFCAFNKDIVNELESRLNGTGVSARTFHSIGIGALKKHLNVQELPPQADKYTLLVTEWASDNGVLELALSDAVQSYPPEERAKKLYELRKATLSMFVNLLNFVRLKLVAWDNINALDDLVEENALDADMEYDGHNDAIMELVLSNVEKLMLKAEEQTRKLIIDFTDMIYWAVKWNVRFYQYQWVMVDECQDLSPVQREMIAKILSPRGGRIILVGDPNQAIYSFAGADSNSFALSAERWLCTVLPLTMTRRCDAIITQHASLLVSSFRCPDDKSRGKIVWLPEETLHNHARIGDMVLSRVKAPLVKACLSLIAERIPATILGADIGKQLVAMLEKITKRNGYTFARLSDELITYRDEQIEAAMLKGDEARAEAIRDTFNALKFVIEAYPNATDIKMINDKITSLFADGKPSNEVVTLATIHKSKGLEADRVFILAPDKLPLRAKNMTPEQYQQEINLDYVARTRAQNELVYMTNEKFLKANSQPGYVQDDFADKVWDMDEPIAIVEIIEPIVIETPTESHKPIATVDAVFKPDGMFVEAFTPEPLAEEPLPKVTLIGFDETSSLNFVVNVTALLALLPKSSGLFAVDGATKMYVAPHITEKTMFFVETVNGEYTQETLTLKESLAKMEAFSPIISTWNTISANDWMFATAQHKTMAERRTEKLATTPADTITDMVAELGGVIEDISSEAPVTPSADALLWDMIAQCLKHPHLESGERLALAIHFSASAYLPTLDWADRQGVATLRVAIKRVMREHQYPPSWTKHNMTDVVNDLVHLFQYGSLPLPAPDTHEPEPADTLIEAPQPTVAPISTPTTFSIGENGKATAPTPEPLPATAPDLLKLLIEQFRDFELVELDIVLQAIAYVKREKSDAGVAV